MDAARKPRQLVFESSAFCGAESPTHDDIPVSAAPKELELRQRLIEAHVDTARNIARALARRYGKMIDPDDIDGCAMVGLCEAAARFDRTRVEPFVAFAERRIRGAVLDEIRRLGMQGRVRHKRQRRISTARREIAQAGAEPTDHRIAMHLGISVEVSVRWTAPGSPS